MGRISIIPVIRVYFLFDLAFLHAFLKIYIKNKSMRKGRSKSENKNMDGYENSYLYINCWSRSRKCKTKFIKQRFSEIQIFGKIIFSKFYLTKKFTDFYKHHILKLFIEFLLPLIALASATFFNIICGWSSKLKWKNKTRSQILRWLKNNSEFLPFYQLKMHFLNHGKVNCVRKKISF